MRPPKDSADFSAHIAQKNGIIWVYCVECERWTKVIVIAVAQATYRQNHWPTKTEDARHPGFHCGIRGCFADVAYLLSDIHKAMILKSADVPMPCQKVSPPQVKRVQQQLRFSI